MYSAHYALPLTHTVMPDMFTCIGGIYVLTLSCTLACCFLICWGHVVSLIQGKVQSVHGNCVEYACIHFYYPR